MSFEQNSPVLGHFWTSDLIWHQKPQLEIPYLGILCQKIRQNGPILTENYQTSTKNGPKWLTKKISAKKWSKMAWIISRNGQYYGLVKMWLFGYILVMDNSTVIFKSNQLLTLKGTWRIQSLIPQSASDRINFRLIGSN